ncbi:MAG: glycoside hydrolase family 9 protein [Anaerorhabdus sp.]|uniref:glycoside hydrolase family 9 protein n=1 Tax=Anaerorhabdus sp. TaxID=1872524 RepID=UPI002FC6C8C1
MKKLLALLLSFILIGLSLDLVFNKPNDNEDNINTETNNPIPTINTEKKDYAPIEEDNTTGFKTSWFSGATDGNITLSSTFDVQTLSIEYPGTAIDSAQFFREGIPFIKDNQYIISFDIESDTERSIELVITNAQNNEKLYSQIVNVGAPTNIRVEYLMDKETTWNGKVALNVGYDGKETTNSYHSIKISNLTILDVTNKDNSIKVNHLGYNIKDQKQCVFPYSQGDFFNVIDVVTGSVVYTGAIKNRVVNANTGETNYIGDFTNVMTPGTYRIESQIVGTSYEFEIGDNIFDNLANDLLKMLTAQRCGYDLGTEYIGELAHASCHKQPAIIHSAPEQSIDATGGWHDAGDYGRYVETGAKAVSDLLFAYLANPGFYGDDLAIPESGNTIPDILDEARYELEWMLKMQTSWGEVYSKVVTPAFASDVVPEQDNQPLYIVGASTISTGDFVAVMALASDIFKEIDPDFSNRCLEAAILSWEYLSNSVNQGEIKNPEDISAGEYRDDNDSDERFYAAISMWNATGDDEYLKSAKEEYSKNNDCVNGISWKNVGGYGRYLYLQNERAKKDKNFYDEMLTSLTNEANTILGVVTSDGYSTSISHYSWGSNGTIADNGILLNMAYEITGNMSFRQAAVEQLNYLLGKNALNMTFISGEGYKYPINVHSRLAKAKNALYQGALIGGANSDRDDTMLQELGENIPSAKMYLDKYNSYSTNEVAIYWNSALLYLVVGLD